MGANTGARGSAVDTASPGAPRSKPSRLKLVLFASIPFAFAFALAEWGASAYLHHRWKGFNLSVQSVGQMAPSGYQLWEHPSNYVSLSKLTRYNNLGFRRFTDTAVRKPAGTIRIFFMGGSAALGAQANQQTPYYRMSGQAEYSSDETISAYLERALKERHPGRNFEVINAATNWSQLHQQMIHYYRKLRSLQPDLVISMDGQNDLTGVQPGKLNVWDSAQQKVQLLNDDFRTKLRPVMERSHLMYLVGVLAFGSGAAGKQPIDRALVDAYKDRGIPKDFESNAERYYAQHKAKIDRDVREYVSHLQHFGDALKRDGVRGLFLLQPELMLDRSKPLTDIEDAIRNHLLATDRSYEVNFARRIEQQGDALRAQEGLPFYSFLQVFGGRSEEIYTDYCHMTPVGNRVLAGRLATLIEEKYPELVR